MQKRPKLTIGMATFDDFHGVYFTVQSLRTYHRSEMADCELIVIDNNPGSAHGQMTRNFIENKLGDDLALVRYIPMPEATGTSQPRNRVFTEAVGQSVICIDCHVLLWPGSLRRLIHYYDQNPQTRDLLSGPMLYDDLREYSTHFNDEWRSEMWGSWGKDQRADNPEADPFEVPGMGLGLFTCRKDAWLGFNPNFRGFGGEEMYIHHKFRQAGAKCLCLPFLRWGHRFGRPDGVKYPITRFNKVRNYVIGHNELGLPLDRVKEHFVVPGKMKPEEWNALASDPLRFAMPQPENSSCGSCGSKKAAKESRTLEQLYKDATETPSDINGHCEKLKELAAKCDHVTDFGARASISTVALLAGQPGKLVSYIKDGAWPIILKEREGKTEFVSNAGDSLTADIEETDMLFIDTVHTAEQFHAELVRLAPKVRRYIVRHDTAIYGERGEHNGPGLLPALRKFLYDNPQWSVCYHTTENHGLTVISCDDRDKPDLPGKITMAANLAKAIAGLVADGGKKAEKETVESRLEICTLCDQRANDRCSACGCYLAEKASWRSSECPLGKWPVTPETEAADE